VGQICSGPYQGVRQHGFPIPKTNTTGLGGGRKKKKKKNLGGFGGKIKQEKFETLHWMAKGRAQKKIIGGDGVGR